MKKILLILSFLFFFINVNASSYTITSVNLSDNSSVNNSTLFSNGNVYTTSSNSFYGFTYWSMPISDSELADSTYLITKVCSTNPITEEPYSSNPYVVSIYREVITDNINCSVNGVSGKYYYLGGGAVLSGSVNGNYNTGYFGAKYNAPSGTKLVYINSIAYNSNEYVNFKNGLESINLNSNKCPNLLNFNDGNTYSMTANQDDSFVVTSYYVNLTANKTYYVKWKSNKTYGGTAGTDTSEIFLLKNSAYDYFLYGIGRDSTITPTQSGTFYLRVDCNKSGSTCSFYDFIISEVDSPYCKFGSLSNPTNDLKDSITDDSVSDPDGFITQFTNMLASNGTITQLITLPITMFTNILNNVNGTCSSFNVGNLLGTDLIFPCIDVSTYLGSTLWGVIDVICSGFFVLTIAKKMIKAFNNFSGMKEGDVINND